MGQKPKDDELREELFEIARRSDNREGRELARLALGALGLSHSPFELVHEPGFVVGQSIEPLQFQPTSDWQREYGRELRRALVQNIRGADEMFARFDAVGAPGDPTWPDIENVLIYNIGAGTLGNPASMLLTRGQLVPDSNRVWRSRVEYSPGWIGSDWRTGEVICTWARVPIGRIKSVTQAAPWWAATLSAMASGPFRVLTPRRDGPLGLAIVLFGEWRPSTLPTLIKPVVDGVLSAFAPQILPGPEHRAALVERTGLDEKALAALVNGHKPLFPNWKTGVVPYRSSIQHDAADHLLVQLEIRFQPGLAARSMSGVLYSAESARDGLEEDDLGGGIDARNPCPQCGFIPWAPADGSGRHCRECGHEWRAGSASPPHYQ